MNGHQNEAFSYLTGALKGSRKVNGVGADYAHKKQKVVYGYSVSEISLVVHGKVEKFRHDFAKINKYFVSQYFCLLKIYPTRWQRLSESTKVFLFSCLMMSQKDIHPIGFQRNGCCRVRVWAGRTVCRRAEWDWLVLRWRCQNPFC